MRGQKAAFTLTEGATHVAMPPTRVRFAFTLTEVLLAVVIVGVLAALVLPAVVTHFQEKGFNQAYERETKTLQSAIEGLAVNENKASFFETMMYKDAEPENYSDSAEAFLKKYLRVSKICGDNNGDCFGKTYYEYKDHDKHVYNPEFKGSCAVLKNGASICLTPQVGASPIVGLIDLNGRKAPNVLGKDLRTFSIAAETRLGHRSDTEAVLEFKFDPIVTDEGGEEADPCAGKTCGCGTLPDCDPCAGKTCGCGSLPPCETPCSPNPNEWDLTCCEKNAGSIDNYDHPCCNYSNIETTVPVCQPSAEIQFNCWIPDDPDGLWKNAMLAYNEIPGLCKMKVNSNDGSIYNITFKSWIEGCIGNSCSASIDECDSYHIDLRNIYGEDIDKTHGSSCFGGLGRYNMYGEGGNITHYVAVGGICELTIRDSSNKIIYNKRVDSNSYDKASVAECKKLYRDFSCRTENGGMCK